MPRDADSYFYGIVNVAIETPEEASNTGPDEHENQGHSWHPSFSEDLPLKMCVRENIKCLLKIIIVFRNAQDLTQQRVFKSTET